MSDMIFIAVNGDSVGDSIGQAIASDNHEELSRISGSVKDSHTNIENWVKSVGGRVVASSGDEGIYQINAESANQLEKIRGDYAQSAGHTLTIGVGHSISEASKALLYGKANDKDQIVEYEPAIEDYINGDEEDEPELPSENDIEQQVEGDLESEAGVPEHEEGMSEEENDIHDTQEQIGDELDSDNIEADEEGELAIEGDEESQEAYVDGIGDESEDLAELEENEVGDKAPEEIVEEAAASEEDVVGTDGDIDGQDPNMVDQEQEIEQQDVENEQDDEGDHSQMLTDMISGHMEGQEEMPMEEGEMPQEEMSQEEVPMEEGMMPEEEMPQEEGMMDEEEGEGDEELKSDIYNSLMSFKQNKQMLEEAKQTAPELYQANITMIRAMIEMSKRLGFAPDMEEEMPMEEGEGIQEMSENDIAAQEAPEEEIPQEEMEEEVSAEMPSEDDEEEQFVGKQ